MHKYREKKHCTCKLQAGDISTQIIRLENLSLVYAVAAIVNLFVAYIIADHVSNHANRKRECINTRCTICVQNAGESERERIAKQKTNVNKI